ncbi:MAG: S46 family peptidase [Verrucomicrobia bacterium]|nr:S46 family peptidase [Verrucomicrobiota bacterium]
MRRTFLSLLALLAFTAALPADEGMWLFNRPPTATIKAKYGFELTDEWLARVQGSALKVGGGGSGSFVSADGLVLTNHHVAQEFILKLSTKEKDLVKGGFLARTPAQELKCPDLEIEQLVSIEDVTARVNAAVTPGMDPTAAAAARRKVSADIEKENSEKTGLKCEVITLYQGGAYHLYRAKRYTDVRLVFAPEAGAAAFGGDPDNFEYPRYCLDISLLRVYENGQPAKPEHYLRWSKEGPVEGDVSFVAGYPGRSSRLITMAELDYQRNVSFPAGNARLKRLEVLLLAWGSRSAENQRRAKDFLQTVQNTRKVRDGNLAALYDPTFYELRAKAETEFKARIAREYPEATEARAAFDRIAEAQATMAKAAPRYRWLELGHAFTADVFFIARRLLRAGEERTKPNGERLREYADARKAALERQIFTEQPLHEDLETVLLADSLLAWSEAVGTNDPLVKQVLAGKSPRVRAGELIKTTKLRDLAVRKALYEGGKAAVDAAKDPLIEVARIVDAEARELRRVAEWVEEVKRQSQGILAKARFALDGANTYPDATSTLRLSYGVMKGYEQDGTPIPSFTVAQGLFDRATEQNNREPFELPASWARAKAKLNLKTPYNFVSTHDIIGGSSGSPVVNRSGEFTGIVFDGNIQSLISDFAYDDRQSRTVSVHSSIILEALDKVYGAPELVKELKESKR